jgi:hypothetical protein
VEVIWTRDRKRMAKLGESITVWLEQYNHLRPHQGAQLGDASGTQGQEPELPPRGGSLMQKEGLSIAKSVSTKERRHNLRHERNQ